MAVFDATNTGGLNYLGEITTGLSTPYGLYVEGRYAYIASFGNSQLVSFDLGGAYIQQLQAGATETGTLQVSSDAQIGGDLGISGGLTVQGTSQVSGNLSVAGAGNFGSMLTVNGGPSAAPSGVGVAVGGGSTHYTYAVAAINGNGQTTAATSAATTTGAATLTAGAPNVVSWTADAGAYGYNIYRTASSGAPASTGLIGTCLCTSFSDIGITANGGTAPAVNSITTAFQVLNAAGNNEFAVDTTNNNINIGVASTQTATLVLNSSTSAYNVGLQAGTITGASYTVVLPTAIGANNQCLVGGTPTGSSIPLSWQACSLAHVQYMVLTPEYAGATLYGTGSDIGTMTSSWLAAGTGGHPENYYSWTTTQSTAQSYNIVIEVPIPSNFASWNTTTPISIDSYTTNTSTGTIKVTAYDTTGTAITNWNSCNVTPGSASAWTNVTGCTLSSGTYTANSTMTLEINLAAPTSGTTDLGNIFMSYNTSY
jgi:hypothetical protein